MSLGPTQFLDDSLLMNHNGAEEEDVYDDDNTEEDFQRYLQEIHRRIQATLKTQRSLGGHKPRPIIVDEVSSAFSQLEGQNLHPHDSSSIHLPPMSPLSSSIHLPPMSPLLSTHHFAFPFPSCLLRFNGLDLEVHQWVEVPEMVPQVDSWPCYCY
ncbi:hypothetical protein PVK06_015945 [Gossypium arboreum]|uniref:Uncharacterized protein n=1 Tax=Gossypium arboreum TaxID=29729 RepID=A0ABR0PYY4_GOSAR|nr:hypothetical protein PVK06_015945 [Gossypium arboreum]